MYYQSGNMRNIESDSGVARSQFYEPEDEIHNERVSRYDKSELLQQRSRIVYEEQRSQRNPRSTPQYKDINRVISVTIKYSDKEPFIENLRIQLIRLSDKNNTSMNINLSDDNDSLFLWNFFIRENQYLVFKDQHSLNVDFQRFPQVIAQFVGYVDPMIQQNNRYQAHLEIRKGNQEAELKFLSVGKLKSNLLFSLKFKRANDQQLKIYLSQKFQRERKENIRLSTELAQSEEELNTKKQELEKLGREYQLLEKNKNSIITELEKREKDKIRAVTLRLEQENMQREKQENQRNYQKIQQLSTKLQQYKSKYDDLYINYQKSNQKLISLQSSQNTLRSKTHVLDQQNQLYQKQNKDLKSKQIILTQQYHQLKNQNTKLICNIGSLEDRIKQKNQRLNQNSQIKSSNINQIAVLEENIRQEKKKVQKLEEKNEGYVIEVAKLKKKNQQILAKYQKKKDRFAQSKQIISIQQQKLSEKQKQIKKLSQTVRQIQNQKEQHQRQIKSKQIKIQQLKNSLIGNDQHIEDQRKIISELNKKLNQKTIGGMKSYAITGPLPMYTNISSTSTVGRDFGSTVSSTSESRIRYSPSPLSSNPQNQKTVERIAPPFRKYRQGAQNQKQQQNSYHSQSHSKSPMINRLNQQVDPEQSQKNRDKDKAIGPIKFKK